MFRVLDLTSGISSRPISRFSHRQYATECDVAVIGGGPGGYVAAIRGAQLGLKVTCIEGRGTLGGTCLNVGCIPSKALLHTSHQFEASKSQFSKSGILVDNPRIDLPTLMKYKESTVRTLTQGVEGLFSKNKITYAKGWGTIRSPTSVDVLDDSNNVVRSINTKNIVIATGSEVATLAGLEIDEKSIISSTGALSLDRIPKSMIVVGGGVIGLEMGSVWSRFGTEVLVVEFSDSICAGADEEVAKNFKKILERQKFKFMFNSAVKSGQVQKDGTVRVAIEDVTTKKVVEKVVDVVLVAIGRRPHTSGLGLEKIGVKVDRRGIIETDDHFKTSVPGIYAIGDVIKGPMLAHKAEEEGVAVMENLVSSGVGHVNYDAIPSVIYTNPEVAWVGKTEQQLKNQGIKYNAGKFPFLANSRARINQETDGFVKFLSCSETNKILGVHMIGTTAGELIAEAVLAMQYGASSEDIARTCHAHPTLSEAVKEAALSTYSSPINY